jgi:hypothetical protein
MHIAWLGIPVLFFLLTNLGIGSIQVDIADQIMRVIGRGFPAAVEHYDEIRKVGLAGDETRFVLFLVVALLFEFWMARLTTKRYGEDLGTIKVVASDFYMAPVLIAVSVFVLCFDGVEAKPRPIYDFIADRHGFYYFRQTVAIYGIGYSFTALLLLLLETVRMLRQRK